MKTVVSDRTTRSVRILPMSADESDDLSIEQVQNDYFLGSLSTELNGEFRCRSVLRSNAGTTVLFQYRGRIIASAVLLGSRPLPRRDRYGYTTAMLFDPATIRVFAPVGPELMHRIWPHEFTRFSHVKLTLSAGPLGRFFAVARPPSSPRLAGQHKLARISYNSSGWHHPTGDARRYEARGTYNQKNGFGHEDWLFRGEWEIDGWRYAFIQAANGASPSLLGQPIDATLFTILPDKSRQMVAHITALECLNPAQAKRAVECFKAQGWYHTMRQEVKAAKGNVNALGDKKWAPDVLNVRFMSASVTRFLNAPKIIGNYWLNRRWRYTFFPLTEARHEELKPPAQRRRRGGWIPSTKPHLRSGSAAIEVTPEHAMMQEKLETQLVRRYGRQCVITEFEGVDLCVRTDAEAILYEIKSDASPRAVIRSALGQILEYAYYQPKIWNGVRVRLVIAGRNPLGPVDQAYLDRLKNDFRLPVSYQTVKI